MNHNFYSTYDDGNSLETASSHLKLCVCKKKPPPYQAMKPTGLWDVKDPTV
jgi:hypothetical protein